MAKKHQEDLDADDKESRIQKFKQKAERLSAGQLTFDQSEDCAPEVEEQFWKNFVTFEQATLSQPLPILIGSGISLPLPEEMDDIELKAKLWEIINALALLRVYLHHTNHLNDRELYTQLWQESLREETVMPSEEANFAYHIDLIGSGSEEDNYVYLKYYADEDERRQWAKEWPNERMPNQEHLPFDRDRHLPQDNSEEGHGIQ